MSIILKLFLSIAFLSMQASAEAQNTLKTEPHAAATAPAVPSPPAAASVTEAACPAPLGVTTHHLYGLWQVSFHSGPLPPGGQPDTSRPVTGRTTILFERHPAHADSLRGAMKPIASPHASPTHGTVWLSGDLEDGELILDESDDGQRISAVWVAYPTPKGCGNVFTGNRRLADSDTLQTFTMTKTPGWR